MTTGLIVAVANFKPGTSKSTTSVFLCQAFHLLGLEPVLIDADKGRSAQRWSEDAGGFPWPVVGMATTQLYQQAGSLLRHSNHGVAVIDCPQLEDHRTISKPALRLATDYLVTCAPAGIEFDRTIEVKDELDDVDSIRDTPARRWALLTRTNRRIRSKTGPDAKIAAAMERQGYEVMPEQVHYSDGLFRQTWGEVPRLKGTPFDDIARRLLTTAGVPFAGGFIATREGVA